MLLDPHNLVACTASGMRGSLGEARYLGKREKGEGQTVE